jgi:long-chain fatty acid transport protein
MTMTLKGDASFTYPGSLPVTDLAALKGAGLVTCPGTADLDLPATTSLGFDYKVSPTFSLAAEYARTNWSKFKELRLKFSSGAPDNVTDESWKDTTFVSVGGTWKLAGGWTVRAGAAYDTSAVDETHRTPRIPDNDRKWASCGVSYAISKKLTADVGYSRLFISDGKMALSAGTTPDNSNTTRGNLTGVIQADINILGAQLRYKF